MTPEIFTRDGKVFSRDIGQLYAPAELRRNLLVSAVERRQRAKSDTFAKPTARRMNARAIETARLLRRAIKETAQ